MWKFKCSFRQHFNTPSVLFVLFPSVAYSRDKNPTTRSIYLLWLFFEFEFEFYKMKKPIK